MTACTSPLSFERFVDYWFGDLAAAEQELLEEHLIDCASCARRAEAFGADMLALAEGARQLPRSFLTEEQLAELRGKGDIVDVSAGADTRVRLIKGGVYVFRVSLDRKLLGELERLDVEYLKEGYGEPIFHVSDVPRESTSGQLHFACHGHVLDAHGDATMRLVGTRGGERFTVLESLVRFE